MAYQPLGQFGESLHSPDTVDFRNVRGGVITSKEIIIAGGTQGIIRSQNYDPSSEVGWGVFGDGSASFYGDLTIGANAIILGDVYSDNWNGSIPANLSSPDGSASSGYYLDSSVGSMQLEGNFFLGGNFVAGDMSTAGITIEGSQGLIEWGVGGLGDNPDTEAIIQQGITDEGGGILRATFEMKGFGWNDAGASSIPSIVLSSGNSSPAVYGQFQFQLDGTDIWDLYSADSSDFFFVGAFANKTLLSLTANGGLALGNLYLMGESASFVPSGFGSIQAMTVEPSDDTGSGMVLRTTDNPSSGDPIFQVRSSGEAVRFEVQHDGWVAFGDSTGEPAINNKVGDPGYTFVGNTGTGMGHHATNQIGFWLGGTKRFHMEHGMNGSQLYGSESNDWFEIDGVNEIFQFFINSNEIARFGDGGTHGIRFPGRNTTTDSGLAAWRNAGFPGDELLALSSSRKDKKDIRDANTQKYLSRLDQLRPREYKSRAKADDGRRVFLGLVKEEAQAVWPHWTYEAMTTPFLIAIQDLRNRVKELEAALQK